MHLKKRSRKKFFRPFFLRNVVLGKIGGKLGGMANSVERRAGALEIFQENFGKSPLRFLFLGVYSYLSPAMTATTQTRL